jgi:hypothetical protein
MHDMVLHLMPDLKQQLSLTGLRTVVVQLGSSVVRAHCKAGDVWVVEAAEEGEEQGAIMTGNDGGSSSRALPAPVSLPRMGVALPLCSSTVVSSQQRVDVGSTGHTALAVVQLLGSVGGVEGFSVDGSTAREAVEGPVALSAGEQRNAPLQLWAHTPAGFVDVRVLQAVAGPHNSTLLKVGLGGSACIICINFRIQLSCNNKPTIYMPLLMQMERRSSCACHRIRCCATTPGVAPLPGCSP